MHTVYTDLQELSDVLEQSSIQQTNFFDGGIVHLVDHPFYGNTVLVQFEEEVVFVTEQEPSFALGLLSLIYEETGVAFRVEESEALNRHIRNFLISSARGLNMGQLSPVFLEKKRQNFLDYMSFSVLSHFRDANSLHEGKVVMLPDVDFEAKLFAEYHVWMELAGINNPLNVSNPLKLVRHLLKRCDNPQVRCDFYESSYACAELTKVAKEALSQKPTNVTKHEWAANVINDIGNGKFDSEVQLVWAYAAGNMESVLAA